MKPVGSKGIGYPAYADAYKAASFPFITFSLERKIINFKGHFSSLLLKKVYHVFPEAKKRSWSKLNIFTTYIPKSTKMDWTHMFNSH